MKKDELERRLKLAEERVAELEAMLENAEREMKLTKLRRKVTPHFLFNSISVAVSLTVQSPKTAMKFLRLLAEMYRYLLNYGNDYCVPIEQELKMMEKYFKLMCLRHVDCMMLDMSEEVMKLKGFPLPPLTLQGLLENAIKHNRHTEDDPLTIFIYMEGDFLCIRNEIKPLISDSRSSHMGLAYISETMRLLFDRDIVIVNDEKVFTVKLPMVQMGSEK